MDTNRRLDNRAYYDDFAAWYERHRGHGYHQMVDDLEVSLAERYSRGKRVLEVGCGTGLILTRLRASAASAVGIDLSAGMLAKARERDLAVVQASATDLPFADAQFDTVCSFKVLPHIADIRKALAEMARVTRPGGYVVAEFYNPRSLRYLIKVLKPPSAVSKAATDEAVFTRYDTLERIKGYLPSDLQYLTTRGIRIITPIAYVHRVPILGRVIRHVETRLADLPGARNLGGFSIIVARKQ